MQMRHFNLFSSDADSSCLIFILSASTWGLSLCSSKPSDGSALTSTLLFGLLQKIRITDTQRETTIKKSPFVESTLCSCSHVIFAVLRWSVNHSVVTVYHQIALVILSGLTSLHSHP